MRLYNRWGHAGDALIVDAAPTRRLVPAVDRAARLLAALHGAQQPTSLTDLAAVLKVNKATVLDILLTLRHHGLVARDPTTKRFQLGPRLRLYAREPEADWREAARAALRSLSARTGETTVLGVERAGGLVFLDAALGEGEFPLMVPVGRRLPLTATSLGKVLCAHLPAERLAVARALEGSRGVSRTELDAAALGPQLATVRELGYALDRGEYAAGVFGLAAPVWGPAGLLAGIAVVGVLARLDDAHLTRLHDAVCAAADELSRRLGGGTLAAVGSGGWG